MIKHFIFSLTILSTFMTFSQSFPVSGPFPIRSLISYDDGEGNLASNGDIYADGEYHIIYGLNNGSNIKKPFFIVEGWDPFNNIGLSQYTSLYNDLIVDLRNNDYDVVFLNFEFSGDYIQKNAHLLVKLIQQINNQKTTNEKNILMGFSMGGLVARYALAYMESNNMDHETDKYVSHDSPQMGANVPLGLQFFANDLANAPLVWLVASPTLHKFLEENPSAKQMLNYYFSDSENNVPNPNSLHTDFFSELHALSPSNLGFPIKTKNIGLSNGSKNLTHQSNNDANGQLDPGDELVYFRRVDQYGEIPVCNDRVFFNLICTSWEMEPVFGVVEARVLSGFTNDIEVDFDIAGSDPNKEHNFSSGFRSYDHISGSFGGWLDDIREALDGNVDELNIANQFAFIPTLSALHIGFEDTWAFVGQNIMSNSCHSPFDVVFAETDNNHHVFFSADAKNFILSEIVTLKKYVETNQINIGNSTIVSNKDYEAVSIQFNPNVTINSGVLVETNSGNFEINGPFNAKLGSILKLNGGGGMDWDTHNMSCYIPPSN